MRKRRILCVFVLCLFLCGCSGSEKQKTGDAYIYSIALNGKELVKRPITFTAYDTEGRIEEMLAALRESESGEYRAAIPDRSMVFSWFFSDNTLYFYNYNRVEEGIEGTVRTLRRAALAKSFCSLDSVDRVALADGEGGYVILSEDSFLSGISAGEVRETVMLYYCSPNRDGLVRKEFALPVDGSVTECQNILERLLESPTVMDGYMQTIPSGTNVLGVTMKKSASGTACHVNLSKDFIDPENRLNAVQPALTIYSIVNSLTQLDYVDDVVILVEGQVLRDYFGFVIPEVLSFNPNLVIK